LIKLTHYRFFGFLALDFCGTGTLAGEHLSSDVYLDDFDRSRPHLTGSVSVQIDIACEWVEMKKLPVWVADVLDLLDF